MSHVNMITVPATAKCTIGPSAVTRERCNAPAVTGFVASDGHTHYYECVAHSAAPKDRNAR